jgi:hypothetical protein
MSFFRRHPWWKKSRGWKDLPRRWGRKTRLSLEQLEDRVVPTLGMTLFELDGNTVDSLKVAGDDWDTLFADHGSALAYTGVLADAAPDNTTFTSGSSKDINDLDQWAWGPGSVPKQSDILNFYAAAYVAHDELNVFLGQDRLDTKGGGELGFWLFQQDIRLNPDGTFRGTHTPGDVLILVGPPQGGKAGAVEVYQWDPAAKDNLRLLPSTDDAFGVINSSPIDAAWRSGIPENGFFEAGINLTSILNRRPQPDLDFTSLLAESRSSGPVNSTLQDFVLAPVRFSTGPALEIVKSVNGKATAAPGPSLLAGTAVTFTYEVTNTGARALSNLQVTDDNGTPGYAGDDFSPHYLSGDDGNGVLDPAETWVYTTMRPAVAGPHATLATASGTDSTGRTVADTDQAHYFGAQPALEVELEVSIDGGRTWVDADAATGPSLPSGTAPQFRYTVRNTGNVALGVRLSDSDFALPPEAQPGVLQANDGTAGGAHEFVYVYTGATGAAGQHRSTVTVEASFTDDDNSTTVRASDDAYYFGAAPQSDGANHARIDGGTPVSEVIGGLGNGLTVIGNPALVVAILVGPEALTPTPDQGFRAAPASAQSPATEGFVEQRVALAKLVGGGNVDLISLEAEALPITLTERGGGTVLPMPFTPDTLPGIAFVPEAETFRPLSERLAGAGAGSRPEGRGENASGLLLQPVADKALRLASSLAEADDSVALMEAITGPEAVAVAEPPPGPPPRTTERSLASVPSAAAATDPAPAPGRQENVAPAGARYWPWLAAAGALAPLLLVARRWWQGRRCPREPCPVRGSRSEGAVASLSEDEVNHVRPQ